ncbi:hypothetical protein GCM10027040_13370 [Halomonas shantousis]
MSLIHVALVILFVAIILLAFAFLLLARQIGVLFERVTPMGALVNDSGPKVGDASPSFTLTSLTGGPVTIGAESDRSTLVFFLSPTCPVCKKLLPVLRSVRRSEDHWLNVVLASDGEEPRHRRFLETARLEEFAYVLSPELGISYRVSRLPFAVLVDAHGVVKAKGLVNTREQLESLFNAHEQGVGSIQAYLDDPQVTLQTR